MFALYFLFYELIRISIDDDSAIPGNLKSLSAVEWEQLYRLAEKHCLVGICFAGVSKICSPEDDEHAGMSEDLYYQWLSDVSYIKLENEKATQQCMALHQSLIERGFEACVLKGQGVATLYGQLSDNRQPGDIDVWVPGDYNKSIDFARSLDADCKITANHISLNGREGAQIEIHPWPALFRCPWLNYRFKKYCKLHQHDWVCISEGDDSTACFNIPSLEFNRVYLLVHLYQHTLREGIGMKQLLDYYMLLVSCRSQDMKGRYAELIETIKDLGMSRFASGIMHIMQYVFHLDKEMLICEPDAQTGHLLLKEIMKGGNFGFYDSRNHVVYDHKSSPVSRVIAGINRNMKYFSMGPWEIICSPLWRLWHFCWMKINGYR